MKGIQSILVVIEPKQLRQPALERALALYNYATAHLKNAKSNIKFKLTAVLPVSQEGWNFTSFLAVEQQQLQDQYLAKQKRWLDAYLNLNAMNVEIERKVIFSKQLGKDITELAKSLGCDLLIKTAQTHSLLDNVFYTPLDWQMLRHSPVPVYIAKDHMWLPTGTIAVALDSTDLDENDRMHNLSNLRLLREAQRLAKFTGCKLALINAITPLRPALSSDMPSYTPNSVYENSLENSCKNIFEFANRHNISQENCYIAEGALDEVILNECQKLKPTALFLGTSARRGIVSALIGNICEKICDSLDSDVVVITPKTIIRAVPSSNPSKQMV